MCDRGNIAVEKKDRESCRTELIRAAAFSLEYKNYISMNNDFVLTVTPRYDTMAEKNGYYSV